MADVNEYYKQLLQYCKSARELALCEEKNSELSKSERRLIRILCAADTTGERLISTQIAESLGVTRSAVSQMVDKLEDMGYVKRVSSPTDKKIAYIELSAKTKKAHDENVEKNCKILDRVLSRMSKKDVETMLELSESFVRTWKEEKEEIESGT